MLDMNIDNIISESINRFLDKEFIREDYRQLSIPFDGNHWKYNYEYFIDYIEKIGRKGKLEPDKYMQHNPRISLNAETAWEYDLNPMIYKMNNSSEILPLFDSFLEDYQDSSIFDEERKIEYEQEVYDRLDNLLYCDNDAENYQDEVDEDGNDQYDYEATKEEFFKRISNLLNEEGIEEYANDLLDDFFRLNDLGERPEITYEMEEELEIQGKISELIDECNDNGDMQDIYSEIIELLPRLDISKESFCYYIGEQLEEKMQYIIDKYFKIDKDGLLIIERGISIKDLLDKPNELNNSSYHSSMKLYNDGVGNCWSYSEGYGASYDSSEGTTIVLKGRVNLESVDWEATIGLNFEYDDEREVRLKPNSTVEIDEIITRLNGKHLPFNGPILVSSGTSWQGSY